MVPVAEHRAVMRQAVRQAQAAPPKVTLKVEQRKPPEVFGRLSLFDSTFLAEGEGFEPPEDCSSTVFKTVAFDRSAIPPIELGIKNQFPTLNSFLYVRTRRYHAQFHLMFRRF